MTGFGRARRDVATARVQCEVRTLNHKGLDVKVRAPHGFEHDAVSVVKTLIERGRVDVTFEIHSESVDVDAAPLVARARALAHSLGVQGDVTVGDLMRLLLQPKRDNATDVDPATLADVLAEAVRACVAARDVEGRQLYELVGGRLQAVAALTERLRLRTADAPLRLTEKLKARLEGLDVDPARLAQEAAVLADRVDVTEELERLAAHVDKGRELASSPSPGRKLDLLCQELLREANTLGSKCQDAEAAHLVVELKSEIERMREQVQNVE